jgi:hypothetical protein
MHVIQILEDVNWSHLAYDKVLNLCFLDLQSNCYLLKNSPLWNVFRQCLICLFILIKFYVDLYTYIWDAEAVKTCWHLPSVQEITISSHSGDNAELRSSEI